MTATGQRTAQLHVPAIGDDATVMDAGFALIKAGWYVGPIDQGRKHAGSVLGKGWPAQTSRDPQDVAAWFAGTDYGLFIHVGRSGAIAFDVDDFGQLPDVLRVELERQDVPYQSTRPGGTGRGHYLFTVPEGRQLGNARGELGTTGWGEIRGRNGIVVVQPTRHEKADQGARYLWERGGSVPVLPSSLADMLPDALNADDAATDTEVAAFLSAPANTRRAKPQLLAPILRRFAKATATGGSRHEAALGCAAQMLKEARAGYYPANEAITQLRQAFLEAIGGDRPAGAEFDGIISWATAQAIATPLDDVVAITKRTAQEYTLGARPAEAWPEGSTAERPPAAPPASVEEALDVLDSRKAAAEPDVEVEPAGETEGARDSPDGDVDQVDEPAAAPGAPIEIDITNDPTGILALVDALDRGAIPQTYVRQGDVARIAEFSGHDPKARAIGSHVDVQLVDVDVLRLQLARHANVIKWRAGKGDAPPFTVAASPSVPVLKSVLSETNWPGLRPLNGVVTAPVLRPDGSLLQEPGYDDQTGLYYSPAIAIAPVPDNPTAADVEAALDLIVNQVLGEFPWQDGSDLANYIALLVTPILRPYVGGLTPLGAISATERGSGKTLLTNIIGKAFRATSYAWNSDDKEIAKVITTALMTSTKPVVLWDNVGDRDSVDSPSLAKLLTSEQWDARKLGGNEGFEGTNDRLWLVTGNQIEFGGDIAQRTILVRLDPNMPNPDLRSDFTLGDLDEWLKTDANVSRLLHALLVLARSWIVAGAPREEYLMRGFKQWACAVGGFLMHHAIGGFLKNREELRQHDEEEIMWAGFCRTWYSKFGSEPQNTHELVESAKIQTPSWGLREDPWSGMFLTRSNGDPLSASGLGKMLGRKRGRFFGPWQLRGEFDKRANGWTWAVFPVTQAIMEPAG